MLFGVSGLLFRPFYSHLIDTGIVHMWLHTAGIVNPPNCDPFLISCVLSRICVCDGGYKSAVLSIQATFPHEYQKYMHNVGVTDDGMWLAYPRNYCDNCDCGHLTRSQLEKEMYRVP